MWVLHLLAVTCAVLGSQAATSTSAPALTDADIARRTQELLSELHQLKGRFKMKKKTPYVDSLKMCVRLCMRTLYSINGESCTFKPFICSLVGIQYV